MQADIQKAILEQFESMQAQLGNAAAAMRAADIPKLIKAVGIIEKIARIVGVLLRAIEAER